MQGIAVTSVNKMTKKQQDPLKLKNVVKIKDNNKWYDYPFTFRIDDKYVYVDTKYVKKAKISSHTLVDLIGQNKYNSVGKTVLSTFGMLEKSKIDPYQTVKGGIVEIFAKRYMIKKYGMQAGIELFEVSQFTDFNQFPEAAPFSGVLDIMINKPERIPVEVKSKEMREYENIVLKKQYPKDQVTQGANQAILAGVEKYKMLWGFISEPLSKLLKELTKESDLTVTEVREEDGLETQSIIKSDLWIWGDDYERAVNELELTPDMITFLEVDFTADIRMVMAYREKALKIYNDFFMNKRIDKSLFNRTELEDIKKHMEIHKN